MKYLWLAALVGCGGTGKDSDDPADIADSGDLADPANEDANDDNDANDVGEDKSASLDGVLRDAAGAPIADVDIRFCRGPECRYQTTDGTGAFSFDNTATDWHSFEAVPVPGSGAATVLIPLVFEADQARTVDVVVPDLDPSVPLAGAAAELELGDDLLVTVGADDLDPPLFVDPVDEAAGVRVDPADWPPMDLPATVHAVWYMAPFDFHANNGGLPVRIRNDDLGLKEGTTYTIWVGSYEDSQWLDAGTVTVGPEFIEGDAKLPVVSTVALVTPG